MSVAAKYWKPKELFGLNLMKARAYITKNFRRIRFHKGSLHSARHARRINCRKQNLNNKHNEKHLEQIPTRRPCVDDPDHRCNLNVVDMTAAELWASMSKGCSVATLSPRQRDFLIDLAKKEKMFDVNSTAVLLPSGVRVHIREAKRRVSGYGGTIGTRPTGNFRAEELYLIEFTDTKNRAIYPKHELDHFTREGHQFQIIKP